MSGIFKPVWHFNFVVSNPLDDRQELPKDAECGDGHEATPSACATSFIAYFNKASRRTANIYATGVHLRSTPSDHVAY